MSARIALSCALLAACLQPPPDVGATRAVRAEDTRLLVILREVDALSATDPHAAARSLRETIIPRARANAEASAELHPVHPRAERLTQRLTRLTGDRAALLSEYADALDRDDTAALLSVVRRQRQLEDQFTQLDTRMEEAANEPATRGCGRPTG